MNTPTPRPPIAHTHRGKPRLFTIDGHHTATKPARTPTHRKPGPPTVPEHMGWFYRGEDQRVTAPTLAPRNTRSKAQQRKPR